MIAWLSVEPTQYFGTSTIVCKQPKRTWIRPFAACSITTGWKIVERRCLPPLAFRNSNGVNREQALLRLLRLISLRSDDAADDVQNFRPFLRIRGQEPRNCGDRMFLILAQEKILLPDDFLELSKTELAGSGKIGANTSHHCKAPFVCSRVGMAESDIKQGPDACFNEAAPRYPSFEARDAFCLGGFASDIAANTRSRGGHVGS